jgi:polysaccharide export outer membrane protein
MTRAPEVYVRIRILTFAVFFLVVAAVASAAQSSLRIEATAEPVADQSAKQSPGQPQSPSSEAADTSSATPDVLISSGDLLEVSVYGAPEFRTVARVGGNGELALPLIGQVAVAGLTSNQAAARIAGLLAKGYFNNPQVSVVQREIASGAVSVLGEVQKPGSYALFGSRTLFDAFAAAGGLTPTAGSAVTITHRDRPSAPQTIKLEFDAKGSPTSNVPLRPGDTVVVSKAGIVYVVGDVHQPSGFVMNNGSISVLQAIAMAHGTNPTASLKDAKIIRRMPNGPQQIPIDLRKMLEAKGQDLRLQPDDIVFVPNSTSKSALRKGLETILQTASGVAIYGARY